MTITSKYCLDLAYQVLENHMLKGVDLVHDNYNQAHFAPQMIQTR